MQVDDNDDDDDDDNTVLHLMEHTSDTRLDMSEIPMRRLSLLGIPLCCIPWLCFRNSDFQVMYHIYLWSVFAVQRSHCWIPYFKQIGSCKGNQDFHFHLISFTHFRRHSKFVEDELWYFQRGFERQINQLQLCGSCENTNFHLTVRNIPNLFTMLYFCFKN